MSVDSPIHKPAVALCFFGIARSLRFTHQSIKQNVIIPLQNFGDLKIFGHYFDQKVVFNPRSKEFGEIPEGQHEFLKHDVLLIDEPQTSNVLDLYESVIPFGANWKGDTASLMNLCHQLVSLRRVTDVALESDAEIFVSCRPDLFYHDSFSEILPELQALKSPWIMSPSWQKSSGLNDRFYIVVGRDAAATIGRRADQALEYCTQKKQPLGAETFLGFVARGIPVQDISLRATRIRFDGSYRIEDFDPPKVRKVIKYLKVRVRHRGVFFALKKAVRFASALFVGRRYAGIRRDLNAMRDATF